MGDEGRKSLTELMGAEPSELDETPAVEESAPEPVSEEAADTRPRDEHGRFAKKGEEDESASPAPADDPPFDHAAVKGERTRRQAAETERDTIRAELDALKQQFQQLQQPEEPPAPPPDLWEDTPGWQQHFGKQTVAEASFNARLDMSEMLAARTHDDFDEMKGKFLQMMEANPTLQKQAL